jgi:heme o synthase
VDRAGDRDGLSRAWLGLALACHPLPSIAVTAVATTFAAAVGRGVTGSALVAVTVLASQLSIGWENDYLDRDRDRLSHRADKPIATGMVSANTVALAAIAATVALVVSLPFHGWRAGLVGFLAWLSAEQYNRRAKRTIVSFLPYTISFGLLPSFVLLGGDEGEWAPLWLTAAAALLGAGAHFANVLPDIADDLATGVNGLPQRLGRLRSAAVSIAALATASALLILGPSQAWVPAAVIAAAAVTAGTAGVLVGMRQERAGRRSTAPFFAAIGIAVVDVALFLVSGSRVT